MEKTKKLNIKIFYLIFAFIIMIIMINSPLPESVTKIGASTLTESGQKAISIIIFSLILWITEAIPFQFTGLLGIFLMTIFKVDKFEHIIQVGFGNHIVIFLIGVMIIAAFINRSGLGKRISLFLLSKTGNSTKMIILGFLIVGALLSMWMTDLAVAVMLVPLALSILKEEKLEPLKSNFGKALLIACAWGPIIGGIGTPAGCAPNPLTISFLKEMVDIDISFINWMTFGVPASLLLIFPAWGILLLFFRPEIKRLSKSKEELKLEFKKIPKPEREEIATIIVFLLTIILWLTTPILERVLKQSIPISMPLLLTTGLLFFPKVTNIKWKHIVQDISWSGIILVLSGISIGMMLFESGAAEWLSVVLLSKIGSISPFAQIFAIIFIVSILKVALSSNTVTATIIIPIIITLTKTLGLDTLSLVLPAGLTSSLAFILVTSTPTNVIPYSTGYFSISDMVKPGIVMTIVSSIILAGTIYIIGKLVNMY